MTDWTEKTKEAMNTWMDMQRQMWESWQEAVTKVATPQPSAWERTLEAWQTSVTNTLKAQNEWINTWAASVSKMEGTPDEMAAWVKQIQELTAQWTTFQTDLWQGWVEMSKQLDPAMYASAPDKWTTNAQNAAQAWQDHLKKVMDIQNEWVEAFLSEMGDKK